MEPIQDNSNVGIRSNHDMSYNWLGSTEFGRITPFHVQELIAGDKVTRCRPRIELQMLPLVSPTFGKMDLYVHYFFVPTRLIWKNSPDFFSESGPNAAAVPPYATIGDMTVLYEQSSSGVKRELFKHWTSMGLPSFFGDSSNRLDSNRLSMLPFRAYDRVWWDFYRDTELVSDASISSYLDDSDGHVSVAPALWKHYPKLQMVKHNWLADLFSTNGTSPNGYRFGNLTSDAPVSNPATSMALRNIEALTRIAERMSLSGKRQIDRLFAKYGIKPHFAKVNMSQYLGGAKSTVLVSDITSSADTFTSEGRESTGTPLGQKAGSGFATFNNLNIKFYADEPGYLVGVFHVMPHVHFVQGLDKKWFRNGINDFFRKELEHTGQVAVAKREVGIANSSLSYEKASDGETFAFTQPYYEYKRNTDIIAGDFMTYHDSDITDYDMHYMEGMALYADYPTNRVYNAENMAVRAHEFNKVFFYQGGPRWSDSDDHFHVNIDLDCVLNRPMDGYAVPTLETTQAPHASTANVHSDTQL